MARRTMTPQHERQDGPTVLSTDSELLPVQMTDDEVRERGRELAQRIEAKNEEVLDQKRQKESMKDRLESIDGQIADLSRRVKSGIEDRFVEVVHRLNENMVETVRADTGELLRTRVATDGERQIDLFRKGDMPAATEASQ